jgi:hypothetical protein
MICYHTTDAAEAILRHGFRDTTGSYMFVNFERTGVWLGDSPMDINEGAQGDQVLRVEFPTSTSVTSSWSRNTSLTANGAYPLP